MLLGLIWFALPVIFMLLAAVVTLTILTSALGRATDGEKSFSVNLAVLLALAFATLIFLWIFLGAIDHTEIEVAKGYEVECGAINKYIANFFYKD